MIKKVIYYFLNINIEIKYYNFSKIKIKIKLGIQKNSIFKAATYILYENKSKSFYDIYLI